MEQNKTWVIYKHQNKINGKVYIGQTCQSVQDKWREKGIGYKKSSPIFWKAIEYYGWDNFTHDIIEDNILTREEADESEKYWIQYYDCCVLDGKDKGYNANRGGTGFTSKMASHYSKQNWENEEYRQKFCKKVICVNSSKIYNSIIEAANETGVHKSSITYACNHKHNFAGIDEKTNLPLVWEFYEEGKTYVYKNPKYLQKNSKPVICVTTGKIFPSASEGARHYNAERSTISECCNHKAKSAGRLPDGTYLCWEFYEEGKEYEKRSGKGTGKGFKQVICLNNKQIFPSIKTAADSVRRASSNISACCSGRQKTCGVNEQGEKLKWMFYEEYLLQNTSSNTAEDYDYEE